MKLKLSRYKNRCKRLNGNRPVFIPESDPKNGTAKIEILFVNERPGPKTRETGVVSFYNPDPSARLFKQLFEKTFGLKYRSHIFITNAVIWVPDEVRPRNHPPTRRQIRENAPILKDQIKKIKPKLIVPLGGSALYALKNLYSESESEALRNYKLSRNIQDVIDDVPIPIYPVFHTSGLAQISRKKQQQKGDWLKIKKLLRKKKW